MAITNAQQARQMYKKGSEKPVEQAGVMNYMPSEMVTVPKIAKSSPNTPTAKLAYITPEEQDILVNLNLYGSLDGKPNRGPGGLPSLEGDFGPGGNNPGGFEGGGGSRGDKDTVGTTDRGTGDYQVTDTKAQQDYNRSRAIRDFNRRQVENIGKKKNPIANFFSNIPTPFNLARKFVSKFGPLNNLDFYNQKVVPAGKKTFKNYEDYMSQRMAGTIDAYGNTINQDNDGDGNNVLTLQQLLAQQQAAANAAAASNVPTTTQDPFIAYRFMAEGGIADTEVARQNYFVGGIIKKATKAVKKIGSKVNRTRKKLLKNPYVQTAIALYAPYAIGSTGFMAGASPFMRQAAISGLTQGGLQLASGQDLDAKGILRSAALSGALATMAPAQGAQQSSVATDASRARVASDVASGGVTDLVNPNVNIDEFATSGFPNARDVAKIPTSSSAPLYDDFPAFSAATKSNVATQAGIDKAVGDQIIKTVEKDPNLLKRLSKAITDNKAGNFLLGDGKGGISALKAIGIASALPLLGVGAPEEEDEGEPYRGEGIDIAAIRRDPYSYTAPRFMAEGGDVEPVAKKTMPLLDLDGKEMDLRAEGGFVPIGRMEKADDVPARLSKNEFVFTAEAVRNAGDGDIDKGAEVMYNMMKNLEAGGDVSEESQGLDGARNMFQTSQRLGEVI